MSAAVTRRRFLFQTLGIIGGTMVAGDLLPLLAEAAKRKQVLRVAIERDFETLRPELSAGDTINMLRRLIYTTAILWGTTQRPDGSLIYDPDTIEPVLASSYKVSEDRQLIEFTLCTPPFHHKKARQALLWMVKEETYLGAGIGDQRFWRPCGAFFMCGGPWETDAASDPVMHQDPQKAKQLMQEAGHDGRPVVLLNNTDKPVNHAMALVTQQLLSKIGVKVTYNRWIGAPSPRVEQRKNRLPKGDGICS
jgi:ABC-type transport system substrate-binding protein